MKIFDTHIHFNSEKLKDKWIDHMSKNIHLYNNIGTTLNDSILAVRQAKTQKHVVCSIGIHPLEINNHDETEVFYAFEKLLHKHKNIVAIGETGLDFYRVSKIDVYSKQIYWLQQHVLLAEKYNLPLILHVRNAHKEIIAFLKNKHKIHGIIHSFDGAIEDLEEYLKMDNWMISISPLLFRKMDNFKKILAIIPIKKLLVESDSPWLTENHNLLPLIIEMIAEIKHISVETISDKIFKNSLKIFNLENIT